MRADIDADTRGSVSATLKFRINSCRQSERHEHPIASGYFWYIPPGGWHAMRNAGDEPLTIVFDTVPNEAHGLLAFFYEVSSVLGEDPKPVSMKEFNRLGREHDLILFDTGD